MEARVSIITLGVADLDKSRQFYEKGLGWPVSDATKEDGRIVFFQLGGLVLSLYPRDLLAEDAMVDAAENGFRGITLAHNVRERSEVAKKYWPRLKEQELSSPSLLKMSFGVGIAVIFLIQTVIYGK